jgi:hypothetical protein
LWQQAAQLVDQARQVLADPKRKAALDAKLRSVPVAELAAKESNNGVTDPLAGLLPTGDPLRPISVSGQESEPDSIDMPPGLFGTPAERNDGPAPVAHASAPLVKPEVRPTRRRRSRKKSKSSTWILGLLVIGLLGTTGLLGYFVFYGPGTVEIVKSGNKITISTEPESGSTTQVGPARPVGPQEAVQPSSRRNPRDRQTPKERDPVMGSLLDSRPDEKQTASAQNPTFEQPESPMIESPTIDPNSDRPDSESMLEPNPDPQPAPETADVPMMEAAKQRQALENVRRLIRAAKWDKMKADAESLTTAQLSTENKLTAQALNELADLAIYYREGIKRAVEELEVGNDFEVTDALRVIVVETGDDLLTLRYNKKNRTFKFDEFPFSLAHKLATFQIPSSPTGQAAKAVYQAVAPKATDAHRDEAIQWLQSIDGVVEGADPKRLAETIASVYQTVEP